MKARISSSKSKKKDNIIQSQWKHESTESITEDMPGGPKWSLIPPENDYQRGGPDSQKEAVE